MSLKLLPLLLLSSLNLNTRNRHSSSLYMDEDDEDGMFDDIGSPGSPVLSHCNRKQGKVTLLADTCIKSAFS